MRRRVTVEVDGTIAVLRGWLAHKLAVEAGLRPTFSGVRSGWVFDTKRLPDLVAHLERRRFAVDVLGEDHRTSIADRAVDRAEQPAIDEPTLFDSGGVL